MVRILALVHPGVGLDRLSLGVMEEASVPCGRVELVHVCGPGLGVGFCVSASARICEHTLIKAVTIIILIILERVSIHCKHVRGLHEPS